MIMMALCALLGFVAPFLLAWWLVKKYQVKPRTIVIGAAVFIIFALGLESVLHQVVLKGPYGPNIMGNIWYFAIYGGLAAGIFEETGRFLAMKYLLKKETSEALPGVAYGIGHGGVEMLILFGLTMISNLVLSIMMNAGQADTLLASAPAEAQEQMQAQFAALAEQGVGSMALGVWERISALILQLSLSMIVWVAVRKNGKWLWLFPAAILLHALVDGVAVVLSKSVSMLSVELVLMGLAVAIGAMAWTLAKKLP